MVISQDIVILCYYGTGTRTTIYTLVDKRVKSSKVTCINNNTLFISNYNTSACRVSLHWCTLTSYICADTDWGLVDADLQSKFKPSVTSNNGLLWAVSLLFFYSQAVYQQHVWWKAVSLIRCIIHAAIWVAATAEATMVRRTFPSATVRRVSTLNSINTEHE